MERRCRQQHGASKSFLSAYNSGAAPFFHSQKNEIKQTDIKMSTSCRFGRFERCVRRDNSKDKMLLLVFCNYTRFVGF